VNGTFRPTLSLLDSRQPLLILLPVISLFHGLVLINLLQILTESTIGPHPIPIPDKDKRNDSDLKTDNASSDPAQCRQRVLPQGATARQRQPKPLYLLQNIARGRAFGGDSEVTGVLPDSQSAWPPTWEKLTFSNEQVMKTNSPNGALLAYEYIGLGFGPGFFARGYLIPWYQKYQQRPSTLRSSIQPQGLLVDCSSGYSCYSRRTIF
jgi:hypothetical protein